MKFRALCLLLNLLSVSAMVHADQPVLKACGHHDYPPWNWQSQGSIVGACADMAVAAFAHLGYRLDLRFVGPWQRCQAMLDRGAVDVNICALRNPERERDYLIPSRPMGVNEIAAFVRRDRPIPLNGGWQDLRGKRVGLVQGVSMGGDFDRFLTDNAQVERVYEPLQNWQKLVLGRLDVVPVGREAGRLQLRREGLAQQLVDLPPPLLSGALYVMISRRSPEAAKLAARLDELDTYFARPDYAAELEAALERARNRYLREVDAPGK